MDEGLDQWVEELGAVLAAPDLPRLQRNEPGLDKKWRAGDIAKTIPKGFLGTVAEKLGVDIGLLRSYADVARAYPPDERTFKAAWTVYREVRAAPREQRPSILHDGMTLREARVAVGKGPMDRPKKERQSLEQRASFVLEELQDPAVKALVEREVNSSEVDRKTRKAANSTLDEITRRRKFYETEMRKAAKVGSPDRQFWVANKELADAEHFIYSVARLYDDHAEAMSEEQWADIVKRLKRVIESTADVATRVEGYGDDYIDVEEVPDFLELTAGDVADAEIIGD